MSALRTVAGHLSDRAVARWPGALVVKITAPLGPVVAEAWVLERPGLEVVGLGRDHGEAQRALAALIRAEGGDGQR